VHQIANSVELTTSNAMYFTDIKTPNFQQYHLR